MSIYANFENGTQQQLASNTGWSQFGEWVDARDAQHSIQLVQLWEHGISEELPALQSQLQDAIKRAPSDNEDVMSVADGLLDFVKARGRADVLIISNGVQPDETEDEPEEEESDDADKGSQVARVLAEPEFRRGVKHDYSCVLLPLDSGPWAQFVADWCSKNLSGGQLADKGVEDKPHITVRYGLKTDDAREISTVFAKWCRTQQEAHPGKGAPGRIRASVGNLMVFQAPDYDVLVHEVQSEELPSLHEALGELDHVDTHAEYKPHITIAYLKSGEGKEWDGKEGPLTDEYFTWDDLAFSNRDGEEISIGQTAPDVERVLTDLKKWERKALNRLERKQYPCCDFQSDAFFNDTFSSNHYWVVRTELAGAQDKDDVRQVFNRAASLMRAAKDQSRGESGPGTNSGSFIAGGGSQGGSLQKSGNEPGRAFWGGEKRDQETASLFNGKYEVNITKAKETDVLSKEYFGRELDSHEWGQLVGAPDGSTLTVTPRKDLIEIKLRHGDFIERVALSHVAPGGEITIKKSFLDNVFIEKAEGAPERLAPRMMAYEFKKCEELGIDTVTLEAAGGPNQTKYTGYWRWPQLGFTAPLSDAEIESLPSQFEGAKTVSDIIERDGLEWYKKNIYGKRMFFDLNAGSASRRVFEKYLADRKIVIE
jgi:hypothetical protein